LEHRRTWLRPGRAYLLPPHVRLSQAATPDLPVDWLHFSPSSPLLDALLAVLRRAYKFPREQAAHWLLTEGALSVKEVAAACGYDDPHCFSRVFHRHHDFPPQRIHL